MMIAGAAQKNRFLGSLAPGTQAALEARLSVHGGAIGDVLQSADAPMEAVWFPFSGIISTLRPLERDVNVEVDAAGAEGVVGIEAAIGVRHTADCWVVQSPGKFGRIELQAFLDTFERDPLLREAARHYLARLLTLRAQWLVCNARHTIEQRLAKWLLVTRDRVGDEIQITQDVMAMMLGVRRASVVTALGRFVDEEIVAHSYARVRILDHERLRGVSCGCYAVAQKLLGGQGG